MLPVPEMQGVAPHEATRGADASDAVRTLSPGEILFREGDPRSHVYRVETGALCLYQRRPDGSEDILEFAFPGDLVGLGYLDHHASGAQAVMETCLSCLPRSALGVPAEQSARTRARLTAAIEREVALLQGELVQRARSSSIGRLAALFVTLSRHNGYEGRDPTLITDSLTCGVVADYLKMSVDHLAAQLAKLEACGLVEPCGGGLRLKDLDALEKLAGSGD